MNDEKNIKSWLRYVSPALSGAKEVVVLGMGDGNHIKALQRSYPDLSITVIDPRPELFESYTSISAHPLYFITQIDGLKHCQKKLRSSGIPIPILEFRPCWYPQKIFFEWANSQLIESEQICSWKDHPAEFILESLFT